MTATQQFDSRQLRQVFGSFVTGVTVITTVDRAGKRHGLTANSFSSVSLDPPLILWSQSIMAPSHAVFSNAEYFAVNILAEDQIDISNRFASPVQDKFANIECITGFEGLPLISGCCAYLECKRVSNYPGGDHSVFLGQVQRFQKHNRSPLVFSNGSYMLAKQHELTTC